MPRRHGSRKAHGGHVQTRGVNPIHAQTRTTSRDHVHTVDACQKQPLVSIEMPQSVVQRIEAGRRTKLEHRNLDRLGAQRPQTVAELPSLM